MALKNNNVNMADGGNTHDRSKLRMQKLKKAEPKQTKSIDQSGAASFLQNTGRNMARSALPGAILGAAATTLPKGQGLARRGSGLGTGPVGRSSGTSHPVTRPTTPARPRKPSAGLNPVKPATQTQGRKKNDPWNSPW